MSPFESTLRELLAAGQAVRFRANGESMHPTIRSGDYLRIVPCKPMELRRGDIVLSTGGRGLTAHRIVRISERDGAARIVTQGDHARHPDAPIQSWDILGRLESIEGEGNLHQSEAESVIITRLAAIFVRWMRVSLQR